MKNQFETKILWLFNFPLVYANIINMYDIETIL